MTAPLLAAQSLRSGYGRIEVVHDVDLTVGAGEIVALFGANGAGKTTTLSTLAGLLPATGGMITWNGREWRAPAYRRAREGLALIQGRAIFTQLSVEANLRLGRGNVRDAYSAFPELEPLARRRAGLLSGGEQQMLATGRALASHPSVLLADELSLGLAPVIVNRLLAALRDSADLGLGVLLVEQQIERALAVADRGYVLSRGRVVLSGTVTELINNIDLIRDSYLARSSQATSHQPNGRKPTP